MIYKQFKTDGGQWLTRGLFSDMVRKFLGIEGGAEEMKNAMYWLNENEDNDTRPVLRKEYLKLGQLTGTKFYNKWLGGYVHFLKLMDAPWFSESFNTWQRELHNEMKDKALQRIQEIAEAGDTGQALSANKYIAEIMEDKSTKRGRPSEEEKQGELKRLTKVASQSDEDAIRVGIRLVSSNGKRA